MVAKYPSRLVAILLPLFGFAGLASTSMSPLELPLPPRSAPVAYQLHDRDLGASPEADRISESFAAFELG